MLVKIQGDKFYAGVNKLVSGSGRILLNFKVTGMTLNIQLLGNIICETEVDIKEKDSNESIDVSVTVTQAILLVNKDEDVELGLLPDVVTIRQASYSFSATKEWDDRFILPTFDESAAKDFPKDEYLSVIQSTRMLDNIVKTTKEAYANVVFSNGRSYLRYGNALLVQQTSLPGEFMMSAETARNLSKVLDARSRVNFNVSRCFMLIKSKYKYMNVLIQNVDKHEIAACEQRLKECKSIGFVSMQGMQEDIDSLTRVYKAGKVTFSVTDRSVCLNITDGKNVFTYGHRAVPKVSLIFTVAHLATINKMFGGLQDIEVLIGGNVLCLKHGNKTLLLSGTLF